MKSDEKMFGLFAKSIGENNLLSASGDNPYKIETNKKTFYIYLKKIGSAHLPGKPDVSRIQIPQSTKFDCVIKSDLTFFAIGYDFVDRVYIIWNPEKVKQRLNQSKNFSLYSTFTYQHLVRGQQQSYHYISKQMQDAMIVLPEDLQDVINNPKSYFDSEEVPLSDKTTGSIDWEGMFTNPAGKLTKLANPALLEKLRGCLLQPYPSIPYACNIIVEFYGTDRFPNMELSDWLGLINNIDWNLPEQILAAQQTQSIEEPVENVETNIPVDTPATHRRWSNEDFVLALDLYFKLRHTGYSARTPEIISLAKKLNRTPASIDMRLRNYEYANSGRGLSGGGRYMEIWNKYGNNRELLKKDVERILSNKENESQVEQEIPNTLTLHIIRNRRWTEEEMILALNLYFKLPFGQFQSKNPDVIALAKLINRTASSVAMRLCNYEYVNTGKGLSGGATQCRPIWNKYVNNREQLKKDINEILLKYQDIVQPGKFIFRKLVDKSVLRQGLTIPKEYHSALQEFCPAIKRHGAIVHVKVQIDRVLYDAELRNQNFNEKNWAGHGDVIQIRYTPQSPVAQKIRQLFYSTNKFIDHTLSRKISHKKSRIRIPDNKKEYIDIYTTNEKDMLHFECIFNR